MLRAVAGAEDDTEDDSGVRGGGWKRGSRGIIAFDFIRVCKQSCLVLWVHASAMGNPNLWALRLAIITASPIPIVAKPLQGSEGLQYIIARHSRLFPVPILGQFCILWCSHSETRRRQHAGVSSLDCLDVHMPPSIS